MNIHTIQNFKYRETRNSPNCSTIFRVLTKLFLISCADCSSPSKVFQFHSPNGPHDTMRSFVPHYPIAMTTPKHSPLWKHQIHHLPWHHPHHPKCYKCKGSPFLGHRAMKKQVLYDSPPHLLMIHLLTITYFPLMRLSKVSIQSCFPNKKSHITW